MNRSFEPNLEKSRNLFLGFSESFTKDPEAVDEYLEDEGYNLSEVDKMGTELLKKINLSCQMAENSVKKQSAFESARIEAINIINNAIEEVKSLTNQKQVLRLALYRDYKGVLSTEEVETIINNQTILDLLEQKNQDSSESAQRSSFDRP